MMLALLSDLHTCTPTELIMMTRFRLPQDERVGDIEPLVEPGTPLPEAMRSTLLCFVLVGLAQQHAFCSRYDFGPWPLLEGVTALPERVAAVCTDACKPVWRQELFLQLLSRRRPQLEEAIRPPQCRLRWLRSLLMSSPARSSLNFVTEQSFDHPAASNHVTCSVGCVCMSDAGGHARAAAERLRVRRAAGGSGGGDSATGSRRRCGGLL